MDSLLRILFELVLFSPLLRLALYTVLFYGTVAKGSILEILFGLRGVFRTSSFKSGSLFSLFNLLSSPPHHTGIAHRPSPEQVTATTQDDSTSPNLVLPQFSRLRSRPRSHSPSRTSKRSDNRSSKKKQDTAGSCYLRFPSFTSHRTFGSVQSQFLPLYPY